MTPRTLPREPWRGSMICGWQIAYGLPWDKFCAERKEQDLPLCQQHWDELIADGESTLFAPSVAVGDSATVVRLLWEGVDPAIPVEASAEEMERFAPILDLPHNV